MGLMPNAAGKIQTRCNLENSVTKVIASAAAEQIEKVKRVRPYWRLSAPVGKDLTRSTMAQRKTPAPIPQTIQASMFIVISGK
jgi:hypothetical protein